VDLLVLVGVKAPAEIAAKRIVSIRFNHLASDIKITMLLRDVEM